MSSFSSQYNNLILRYLDNFNLQYKDYAILSMIQHYGGMTPLLDFTEKFEVALYFGSRLDKRNPHTNKIDEYFTIYEIESAKIDHVSKYYNDIMVRLDEGKKEATNLDDPEIFLEALESVRDENANFMGILKQWKYGLISEPPEFKYQFGSKTNLNIMQQSGVFVYNYHQTNSLDETINSYFKELLTKTNISEGDQQTKISEFKPIKAIEINKSIESDCKIILEEFKITKDLLFPDLTKIAKKSEEDLIASELRKHGY